jgi:hypothetical protein
MADNVLVLRNYRYLKYSLALVIASIAIYAIHEPLGHANGGTWVGYTLGTLGAGLIIWLAWFGIRKRRYGVGAIDLQEWLSAHVYLGLSLTVIATLHTGFQIGWNVHTLAYVLMLLVIVSGIWGIFLYIRYPTYLSRNRGGLKLDETMASIADLDRDCMNLGMKLGDEINDLVRHAAELTKVGGSPLRQLSGSEPQCPTQRALTGVSEMVEHLEGKDAASARELVLLLARKNELLRTARRDVQFRAWLNVWLVFHIPLTIGLVAALLAHIIAVFFYW